MTVNFNVKCARAPPLSPDTGSASDARLLSFIFFQLEISLNVVEGYARIFSNVQRVFVITELSV
jgi:hypothetical protein